MYLKTTGILLGLAISASAATIVVNTNDRGYYYNYDFNDTTNKNYLTGQINNGAAAIGFHSFFEFNGLTGLSGPIVSATLSLFNPAGGYSSTQASELLTITGFSGSIATLDGGGTVAGEYSALASGPTYGTQSVNAATDGAFVNITLNAAAIAFLNSSSSNPFAFGGDLAGIPPADVSTRFEFGGSAFVVANDSNTTLTVVTAASTPEPQTLFLIIPSLAGFLLFARSRQARS